MTVAHHLSVCTEGDLPTFHAFVFGRVRIWHRRNSDNTELSWHWSKTSWWKAMWYPHHGSPSNTGAWGVYAGGSDGFTGPGDAELTHWLPMPPDPPRVQP